MTRFAPLAFAASMLIAASAPALAQPSGHYVAAPATAASQASFITRNVMWRCQDGVCAAPKSTSRDAIICELAARELGVLQSFSVGGTAYDAEKLATCNRRAK